LKKRLTNLVFVGVNFTCGMTYEKFSPIKMKELENKNSLRKTIIVHFLIWVLYFAMQFVWRYNSFDIYIFMAGFVQVLSWATIFYVIRLYLYPKYLWKDHNRLFFNLLILYIFFQIFSIAYTEFFIKIEGTKSPFTVIGHSRKGFFWFFNMAFIAFGFTYYDELGNEKEKIKQLELKLKNAELENLKAQFNPHFLFNILWYIYFLVDKTGDKDATKAVTLLSDMMRYSMQKWEVGEFAKLEEEVEYVNNFIELQRLKNPKMCLDYQTEGDMEGVKILPLVMMSFVENGFKHGQTHDPENPLTIRLKVEKGENFIFSVKNKVSTMGKERSSGIGLENVKSRLETAYKEKYNLEITQDKEFYTTKLTIDI
jgi:two-component system, LytTR family, sensor kinase